MESLVWSNRRLMFGFWIILVFSVLAITFLLLFMRLEQVIAGQLIVGEYDSDEIFVSSVAAKEFSMGQQITLIINEQKYIGTIRHIHFETEIHLLVLTITGFNFPLVPKTELAVKIITAMPTLWEVVLAKF